MKQVASMVGFACPVFLMHRRDTLITGVLIMTASLMMASPGLGLSTSNPAVQSIGSIGNATIESAIMPPLPDLDMIPPMSSIAPNAKTNQSEMPISNRSTPQQPASTPTAPGGVTIGQSSTTPPREDDAGWTTIWSTAGSGTVKRFHYQTSTGYGQWYRVQVDNGPYIHWQSNDPTATFFLQANPVNHDPDDTNWPGGSITTTATDANIAYTSTLRIEGITNRPNGAETEFDVQSSSTPPPAGTFVTIQEASSSPAAPSDDDHGWTTIWSATGSGTLTRFSYTTETSYGQWYRLKVDAGQYIHWQSNSATTKYFLEADPTDYPPDNLVTNYPAGSISPMPTQTNIAFSASILIEGTTNRPGGASTTYAAESTSTPPPPPGAEVLISQSLETPPRDNDPGWTTIWSATNADTLTRFAYQTETGYGQWYRIRVDGGPFVHWQSNSAATEYYMKPNPADYPPDDSSWPAGSITPSPTNTDIAYTSMVSIEGITNRPGGAITTYRADTSAPGNHAPVADFTWTETGRLTISTDGGNSWDPDADPLTFVWDWGDGSTSNGQLATHTFACAGGFQNVKLTVADADGAFDHKDHLVWITDTIDNDGDGLVSCGEDEQGTSDANPDTDGDGLSDYVESTRYQHVEIFFDANGGPHLPDPLAPDIYVHADVMDFCGYVVGCLYQLPLGEANTIKDLFASNGINFHLIEGDIVPTKSPFDWDPDMATYYNTYMPDERRGIFRYLLIADEGHDSCPFWAGAMYGEGLADGPAAAIYLGCIMLKATSDANGMYRRAILHEVGHNIVGIIEPEQDQHTRADGIRDILHSWPTQYLLHPTLTSSQNDYMPSRWTHDMDAVGRGLTHPSAMGFPAIGQPNPHPDLLPIETAMYKWYIDQGVEPAFFEYKGERRLVPPYLLESDERSAAE